MMRQLQEEQGQAHAKGEARWRDSTNLSRARLHAHNKQLIMNNARQATFAQKVDQSIYTRE